MQGKHYRVLCDRKKKFVTGVKRPLNSWIAFLLLGLGVFEGLLFCFV